MSKKKKFMNLAEKINNIVYLYFNSKQILNNVCQKNEQKEKLLDYEKIINKVNSSYDKLNNLDKMFINNDFFLQKYPYWWENQFSRATYYRLKRKAMINFLGEYGKWLE